MIFIRPTQRLGYNGRDHNISVYPAVSQEILEKEDRIDEMKKKQKNSPPVQHLLHVQQADALPYAKVVGRPGTGSYPASSPDPTTHAKKKKSRIFIASQ